MRCLTTWFTYAPMMQDLSWRVGCSFWLVFLVWDLRTCLVKALQKEVVCGWPSMGQSLQTLLNSTLKNLFLQQRLTRRFCSNCHTLGIFNQTTLLWVNNVFTPTVLLRFFPEKNTQTLAGCLGLASKRQNGSRRGPHGLGTPELWRDVRELSGEEALRSPWRVRVSYLLVFCMWIIGDSIEEQTIVEDMWKNKFKHRATIQHILFLASLWIDW